MLFCVRLLFDNKMRSKTSHVFAYTITITVARGFADVKIFKALIQNNTLAVAKSGVERRLFQAPCL